MTQIRTFDGAIIKMTIQFKMEPGEEKIIHKAKENSK